MKLDFQDNLFTLRCSYEERRIPKQAGFQWSPSRKCWATPNGVSAHPFAEDATPAAAAALQNVQNLIELSQATTTSFRPPVPDGLELYPYQRAGVQYASLFKTCMIGDEPGLGKTMQAIALANHLGLRDLLVICPASLRLNWVREIEKWSTIDRQPRAILNGRDPFGTCNSGCSEDATDLNYGFGGGNGGIFELVRQGLLDVGLGHQPELERGVAKAQVLFLLQLEHALHVLRLELAGILQQLADVGVGADAGGRRFDDAVLLVGACE